MSKFGIVYNISEITVKNKLGKNEKVLVFGGLIINIEGYGKPNPKFSFETRNLSVSQIKSSIEHGFKWTNVGIRNGKVIGTTGSLSRFKDRPWVIVTEIITNDKRVIGYRLVSPEGKVVRVRLKEMIGFGIRMTNAKKIPIQNAIFVPAQNGKTAYFRANEGQSFLKEIYLINKNPYADKRRVATQQNGKLIESTKSSQIRRLEDIYSRDQINELRIGKHNGVDIRVFANPALSAEQMKVLREGMENKVNVRPYAFPEYKTNSMRFYIDLQENGFNIRQILNPKYNLSQLNELSLAYMEGLDISKMCNPNIKADEMSEIRERLEFDAWDKLSSK